MCYSYIFIIPSTYVACAVQTLHINAIFIREVKQSWGHTP